MIFFIDNFLFLRDRAIFPLEVSSPICGNGDSTSSVYLILLIQYLMENHEEWIQVLREFNGRRCTLEYHYDGEKETFTVRRTGS